MAGSVESSGDIEVFVHVGYGAHPRAPFFGKIGIGDRVALVFGATDNASAPFALKVISPRARRRHIVAPQREEAEG